ncbi:MAG: hypothetical protein HW421_3053 [Ignavibacteria bacterium]|nr:hypothetical protein [Ignavibacteria bacterium]
MFIKNKYVQIFFLIIIIVISILILYPVDCRKLALNHEWTRHSTFHGTLHTPNYLDFDTNGHYMIDSIGRIFNKQPYEFIGKIIDCKKSIISYNILIIDFENGDSASYRTHKFYW